MSDEHPSDAADRERERRIAYGLARHQQHGSMKRASEESGVPRTSLQRAHERQLGSPGHTKEAALQAQEDRIRGLTLDVAEKAYEEIDGRVSSDPRGIDLKTLNTIAGTAVDKALASKPQHPEANFAANLFKGLAEAGLLELTPQPEAIDAEVVSDEEGTE